MDEVVQLTYRVTDLEEENEDLRKTVRVLTEALSAQYEAVAASVDDAREILADREDQDPTENEDLIERLNEELQGERDRADELFYENQDLNGMVEDLQDEIGLLREKASKKGKKGRK